MNRIIQMWSLTCGWVADEYIVFFRDSRISKYAKQLSVHTECLAHRFSLIFLTLKILCEIREHVVFWDDIYALNGPY
ncbi:hypothetical protein C451_03274 [Halococcus thailandensis JCM 13552]|uniref:Uncharacterized protein n=1 Tax=Halococcus thailandensis JCM 13552 TaxID=1227457 RepID=M0NGL6_9EURY|nr:hypothetical protein C451_03274 [Halococcus thailandensis JCM 13552]